MRALLMFSFLFLISINSFADSSSEEALIKTENVDKEVVLNPTPRVMHEHIGSR
jgi:hypothetical protein